MSDATHKLCYFIHGKSNVSTVFVSPNETIGDLKEKIYNEAFESFITCNAPDLILTKVDANLDGINGIEDDIYKGKYRLHPSNVQPLRDRNKISAVWPQLPSGGQLHVYASLPCGPTLPGTTADSLPLKRRRLADDAESSLLEQDVGSADPFLNKLWQFWKSLWRDKENFFREDPVRRDPNTVRGVDVPETIEVLRLPVIFSSIREVLVRADYDEAMRDIEGYCTENKKSVIIGGHPGIGKTILLYYILVKRLLEQKPTILQRKPGHVILFNADGVKEEPASKSVDPELKEYQNTWALIDINQNVQTPAVMVTEDQSPFFCVMATPPRPSRLRELEKFAQPAAYWLMKPFTLAELIQAQRVVHNESDIKNFFEKYGPSARDCYNFCKADDLNRYDVGVRSKVKNMSWDLITKILTTQLEPAEINAEEGSYKVLLVEPQPDNRAMSGTRIMTKTISQYLWQRDSVEKWRNHRKLFKTLLREADAKGLSGLLFEPAFHSLCGRGATFTIYPMDHQLGPVHQTFTNVRPGNSGSDSTSEALVLNTETQFSFDDKNQITSLVGNRYYQPTTSNHPSFDSFVYDPNSRRINAFQVTTEDKHGLTSEGVTALCELGKRLHIPDLKIRIIVVVFGAAEVTFKIKKRLINSLDRDAYILELTENQLYSGIPSELHPQLFLSP